MTAAPGPEAPRHTIQLATPVECAPFVDDPCFVLPVLFPDRRTLEPTRILHAGASAVLAARLADRWAPSPVTTTARGAAHSRARPLAPTCESVASEGPFDLIVWDARALPSEMRAGSLGACVESLSPGGVLIASFPARLARAGLLAVGALLRLTLPYAEPEARHEVAARLLRAIPHGHHFRTRPEPLGELRAAGTDMPRLLAGLEEADLSTVSGVRAQLEASGADWGGWLFPSSYDPAQCVSDEATARRLAELPEPTRSVVCELIAAHPTVHHAVARRSARGEPGPTVPTLDRVPVRLPLYDWQALGATCGHEATLEPSPRTEFTGRVRLRPWQARLLLAADGERRGGELLAEPEVRRGFDIPRADWETETARFLERAVGLRLLALLPPRR